MKIFCHKGHDVVLCGHSAVSYWCTMVFVLVVLRRSTHTLSVSGGLPFRGYVSISGGHGNQDPSCKQILYIPSTFASQFWS